MKRPLIPYPTSITWYDGARDLPASAITYLKDEKLPEEGYKLRINETEAVLSYATDAGRFYGEQTLRQLRNEDGTVPFVDIEDAPKFGWR
ncbi:MAG: hypothetical protein IKR49_09595, partial [Clostridia bacterium]|nr:hypothetical protein [Clostridia bacterium]